MTTLTSSSSFRTWNGTLSASSFWATSGKPSRSPPQERLEQFRRAQAAHKEIAQRFKKQQYTYILGNHDLVAEQAVGARSEYILEVDGMRLLFAHGHQSDFWCHQARSVSESLVRLGTWLKSKGLKAVHQAAEGLETSRNSGNHWMKKWAFAREADVVVTGHTHLADKEERDSRLFLNSGHCDHGNFSFLALDTRALSFDVHRGF